MGSSPTLATKSECSAVWSACLIWIQEVVGSNPTTPTTNKVLVRGKSMEYKGIKLTEVTESQIIDPPKKMLVWDYDPGIFLKLDVLAIVNGRENGYPVITTTGTFRHCAEIPEESTPRRATNRELARWCAQGNGENTDGCWVYHVHCYPKAAENNEVSESIVVRKWNDADWHEPTVDYMGIEQ